MPTATDTSPASRAAAYRAGKLGLKGFFVGQVMRGSQGRADPGLVQRLVEEALQASEG